MTDPITPPPELVQEWAKHILTPEEGNLVLDLDWFAAQSAQWGADMELGACCEWFSADAVSEVIDVVSELRAARRPKPSTLKEQAFAALKDSPVDPVDETLQLSADAELIIRRALEALDD